MKHQKISKQWTKDDIKKVVRIWTSMSGDEICDELAISKNQLYYIVRQIREVAPKALPKKHRVGVIQNLIKEALAGK